MKLLNGLVIKLCLGGLISFPKPNRNGWLIPILFTPLLITACHTPNPSPASPTNIPLPASPSPTLPPEPGPPTEHAPVSAPSATQSLSPTSSPTPTVSPTPSYTIMGVELVGDNFTNKVPLVAKDGAGWVRWNAVFWTSVEPQEGERQWRNLSSFDARAEAVSAEGMRLIAIVRHTPAWAQAVPGYSCGPVHPDKLDAFGRFMHDLVVRYSQPPYNVKYWELGNEPDISLKLSPPDSIFGCWGDDTDPYYGGGTYAEMLKAVYPQIKAADPEAQVLVGGLLLDCDPVNPPVDANGNPKNCTPSRFLEGILVAGGGNFFDGISFHAYDYYYPATDSYGNTGWHSGGIQGRMPVSSKKVQFLRGLLILYGHPEKYLINTETALICGRDQNEPECKTEAFEITKTSYVVQSYSSALADGLRASIWYHYQEGWRFSGLTAGNLQPRSALLAFRVVSQKLNSVIYWGSISEFDGVTGYKFIQPREESSREIWVIWCLDTPRNIRLSKVPTSIFDMFGNSLPVTDTLEISPYPLYLEWAP